MMIEQVNSYEHVLIDRLKAHPVFLRLEQIEWDDLLKILIQRRFLSLSIVNVYEFVIDAVIDPDIKQTVRGILNEEYPRNTKGVPLPSHRELLFQDLLNLGATAEMILKTPETEITQQLRAASNQIMVDCLDRPCSQVGLIAFLRFWAEVTVSVEYSCLWPRISERLAKGASRHKIRSEFYYFHMIHDNRSSDLGKEGFLGGLTHAQELAIHLQKLITDRAALDYCLKLEQQAYQLKYQFYDQFLVDRI
jgi:hypothetical protein